MTPTVIADIPIWDWHWDWWVDHSRWQLWLDGVVNGMVFGLLALGLVLVYRSTRVINLAVGNLGIPSMALMAVLVMNYGVPFWLALFLSLGSGLLAGAVIERAVIRQLFTAPRVIILVATIGVSQLMQAVALALPDVTAPAGATFPVALEGSWSLPGDVEITGPALTVVLVTPVLAGLLVLFLNRTLFGQTVQASADNPDLARLSGIDPKLVSFFVWTVAGGLAAISMIMLAGTGERVTGLTNLGPSTMTRALAAFLLAGMVSFPRALLAGLFIGILQAHISFIHLGEQALVELVLLVIAVGVVALRSRGERSERGTFSFAPKRRPVPSELKSIWWVRNLNGLALGGLLVLALAVPLLLVDQPSRYQLYARVVALSVMALSVVVITGWSGQLSLGQAAFAGIGALLAAAFNRGLELGVGIGERHWFSVTLPALPWLLSIGLGALVTAGIAGGLGVAALRVRGLMLAVITFIFAMTTQQYLFDRPVLKGDSTADVPFRRGTVAGFDLSSHRSYYLFSLATLVVVFVLLARLRRSGVGRSIIAVRENEDSASAYTLSPALAKITAFALAGALAAVGGSMMAGTIESVPTASRFFQIEDSLLLVAVVVIGGLGTQAGAIVGALWVAGLPAFWPENTLVPIFTSSIGLLVLLLYFPGGLLQLPYALRDAVLARVTRPAPEVRKREASLPASPKRAAPATPTGEPVLSASGVGVEFGGLRAVADVDFEAHPDEIVGLIGTNGAGKSTLMNAIGGFVPSSGEIRLDGRDITGLPAHGRARLGLGRTFQAAELFPELTIRETILTALEARGRTGFVSTALLLPHTFSAERSRMAAADDLIDFLGLGSYADRSIAELSTGTRRIVELASLLALDARVLCLDEPTAGLAQRETESFCPLIQAVQSELHATVILIEHDMPLIMSLSDRVYCLESGSVIATGSPAEVRADPAVIASYLGTDQRAIERSGPDTSRQPAEPVPAN